MTTYKTHCYEERIDDLANKIHQLLLYTYFLGSPYVAPNWANKFVVGSFVL
jgi:hypothetical protein